VRLSMACDRPDRARHDVPGGDVRGHCLERVVNCNFVSILAHWVRAQNESQELAGVLVDTTRIAN